MSGTKRKKARLLAKLLLSLATLVVMLVVAELGMRVLGLQPRSATVLTSFFQPDPSVGWIGRPNAKLRFNSSDFDVLVTHDKNGFRNCGIQSTIESDSEFDGEVVWCVGDSITWSWGVADEDSWVYLLNKKTDDHRIYRNLGLSGSSTLQQYFLLKKLFGQGHRPNEVLVYYCVNDPADCLDTTRSRPHFEIVDGKAELRNYPAQTPSGWNRRAWLKRNCLVYNYLSYSAMRAKFGLRRLLSAEKQPSTEHIPAALNAEPVNTMTQEQAIGLRAAYSMIAELCRENNVSLMVSLDSQNADAKEICEELSIPVIDLADYFVRHKASPNWAPVDFKNDPHWNELGNKIAADALFEQLEKIRAARSKKVIGANDVVRR